MNVKSLQDIVSVTRLYNYVQIQPDKAVAFYEQNIMLSRSFYPLISVIEVALRNAIDRNCITHFADPNWLINQKPGFMSDRRLTYVNRLGIQKTNDFLKKSVEDAEKKIQKGGRPITHNALVGELNFGFWTELFQPTHYALLQGTPIRAFPNLPKGIKRVNVFNILNEIRIFRNRVFHNEPICFHAGFCGIQEPSRIRKQINDVLNWLSPNIMTWLNGFEDSSFELALMDRYASPGHTAFSKFYRFIVKISHIGRTTFR